MPPLELVPSIRAALAVLSRVSAGMMSVKCMVRDFATRRLDKGYGDKRWG